MSDAIMEHLTKNSLMSEDQHGFVRGKNCATNLLETIDLISTHLANGDSIDIFFTDLKQAFDTVLHKSLGVKMLANGIGVGIVNWTSSFLTGHVIVL